MPPPFSSKLTELFRYAGDHDIPLYVLIDEYDNFANTMLAMDDVTSGFNIGSNLGLEPDFNEMVGFTEAVRRLLETYREHGVFDQDVDEAMAYQHVFWNTTSIWNRRQCDGGGRATS